MSNKIAFDEPAGYGLGAAPHQEPGTARRLSAERSSTHSMDSQSDPHRRHSFAASFLAYVGDQEFAEDHTVGARSKVLWFLLKQVLPFLKLMDEPKQGAGTWLRGAPGDYGRPFILGALIWLLTVFSLCYLTLSLASWTSVKPASFEQDLIDDSTRTRWKINPKEPAIGGHYPYVIIVKHLLELALFHHICANLMKPLEDLRTQKREDTHLIFPLGVVQTGLKWMRRLTGMSPNLHWLSDFIVDDLLVFGLGFGAVLHQINMVFVKQRVNAEVLVCETEPHIHHFCINDNETLLHSITGAYVGVIIVGFLVTCLFFGCVPVAHRRDEFNVAMTLCIILWLLEFLVILMNRNVYTAMWSGAKSWERSLAAFAQIFVTHSTAMMGAIRMGHTSHFRKCPDLTWSTFFCKLTPLLGMCCVFYGFMAWRRMMHDWPLIHDAQLYSFVVSPWGWIESSWDLFGGLFLLWNAHLNGLHSEKLRHAELEAGHEQSDHDEDVMTKTMTNMRFDQLLDYDGSLIAMTFGLAIFYNVMQIFEVWAEPDHTRIAFGAEISKLFAPFGVAVFAFSVWRSPPRKGSMPFHCLWFALGFTISQFMTFQINEDCHISSDLPACCSYPGLGTEHLASTCDKSRRCLNMGDITLLDRPVKLYCAHNAHHGAAAAGGHGGHEEGPAEEADPHHLKWLRLLNETKTDSHGSDGHGQSAINTQPDGHEPAHSAPDGHDGAAHHNHTGEHGKHTDLGAFGDCCCCHVHTDPAFAKHCGYKVASKSTCPNSSSGVVDVDTACHQELHCRWEYYKQVGGAAVEARSHLEGESAPFELFDTLGMAGSVEMYFTIIGILLKVIFLTQHPKSEEVLALDVHHSQLDHATGEHEIVSRSFHGIASRKNTFRSSQHSGSSAGDRLSAIELPGSFSRRSSGEVVPRQAAMMPTASESSELPLRRATTRSQRAVSFEPQ